MDEISKNIERTNYALPSEIQLTNKFNVSRTCVRKAFKSLSENGVIERIQGSGSFINRTNITNQKSRLISLIMPDSVSKLNSNFIKGISNYCNSNNFNLIVLYSLNSSELEEKLVLSAYELNCLGIIVFPTDNSTFNNELLKLFVHNFPIVFIDRKYSGLNCSFVGSDQFTGCFDAVKNLTALGHKNICYISPNYKISSLQDRIRGFESALLTFRNKIEKHNLFVNSYTQENLSEVILKHITENPQITAFILNSGEAMITLLNALKLAKKNLKEIDFVVFDDEQIELYYFADINPIILKQDSYSIGYTAAKLIHDKISNANCAITETLFPIELICKN
jgi:GntR family transcriptional regulator of arabinose operon